MTDKNNQAIKAIRGFNDTLPDESNKWRQVESILTEVMDSYGYTQIRLPLVEETQLFARGVGEATDIVEKEMFAVSHASKNQEAENADSNAINNEESTSFSLRPEGHSWGSASGD